MLVRWKRWACGALIALPACSGEGAEQRETPASGGAWAAGGFPAVPPGGGGAIASAGGAPFAGGAAAAGGAPAAGGQPGAPVCSAPVPPTPLARAHDDLFVLLDQSTTMGEPDAVSGTRWSATTTALTEFAQDAANARLGLGIQYFGLGRGGTLFASCDTEDYAAPDVAIAELPANVQPLLDSLGRHGPSAKTPSAIALQGAVQYVRSFVAADPTRRSASVVLVTAGEPDVCRITSTTGQTPLDDLVQVAAEGLGGAPRVSTYVVGVSSTVASLDRVATAGGTNAAYFSAATDVRAHVKDALTKIRVQSQVRCTFTLPAPVATPRVQVDTPGAPPTALAQTASCAPGAFGFYVDPAAPGRVVLCDAACQLAETPGNGVSYQACTP